MRIVPTGLAKLALLLGIAATAFAGPATVTTPVLVSGASPFAPDGCGVDSSLLHSGHDATLAVSHLGGPFDLRQVPLSNGNAIPTGDHAGLVPLAGEAFGALSQRGNPPETVGATDVFLARVALVP